MERYYKFLTADGKSPNGGNYQWSLPVQNADGTWTPGDWIVPVQGDLELCKTGYHICEPSDMIYWINARLFVVEVAPGSDIVRDTVPPDSKTAVRSYRLTREVTAWNDRTARLFAVWCARNALVLVEQPDPRCVAAVDTAERYANGEATSAELTAASDAAWDAASAASAAASAAARAAAWDAASAASAAASAAWAAASAAWAAARAAARGAQTAKLLDMIGESGE